MEPPLTPQFWEEKVGAGDASPHDTPAQVMRADVGQREADLVCSWRSPFGRAVVGVGFFLPLGERVAGEIGIAAAIVAATAAAVAAALAGSLVLGRALDFRLGSRYSG